MTRICLFAKPPIPGRVKTRLIPAYGAEGAANIARAFLLDTWQRLQSLEWADVIVASTGPFPDRLAISAERTWDQGDGDLGARIERILQRAIGDDTAAIAIGADAPTVPLQFLEDAQRALSDHHAVIGRSEDGGFYLIGLRDCPPGLFDDLPWSSPDTFAVTYERLQQRGMSVALLGEWYDIDRPEDVERLWDELRSNEAEFPNSFQAVRDLLGP